MQQYCRSPLLGLGTVIRRGHNKTCQETHANYVTRRTTGPHCYGKPTSLPTTRPPCAQTWPHPLAFSTLWLHYDMDKGRPKRKKMKVKRGHDTAVKWTKWAKRAKGKAAFYVQHQKLVAKTDKLSQSPCGLEVCLLFVQTFTVTMLERERENKRGRKQSREATNRLWWDNGDGTPGRIISRENYRLIHGWHVSLSYTLKCLQHWYLLNRDVIRPQCNTQSFCSDLHGNTHHVYRCNNQEADSSSIMFASNVVPRNCDMTRAGRKLTLEYLRWSDDGWDVD